LFNSILFNLISLLFFKTRIHSFVFILIHYLFNKNKKQKVEINSPENYASPLHHAAFAGNDKCIELLIKAGASANLRDQDGSTPIHKAAFNGFNKCVRILIEKANADVNISDGQGL